MLSEGKEPPVPTAQGLGGPQSRPGAEDGWKILRLRRESNTSRNEIKQQNLCLKASDIFTGIVWFHYFYEENTLPS
jgi:hypothetical protein